MADSGKVRKRFAEAVNGLVATLVATSLLAATTWVSLAAAWTNVPAKAGIPFPEVCRTAGSAGQDIGYLREGRRAGLPSRLDIEAEYRDVAGARSSRKSSPAAVP